MKKILLLTCSPRKGGNSEQMADAFEAGAAGRGNQIVRRSIGNSHIEGCRACKCCFRNGNPCCREDDFNGLAAEIESADVLIFASPLYSFSLPAQLKAVLDRCYCFAVGRRQVNIKECALLICGGEEEEFWYQGAVASYELYARYQKWENRGVIIGAGESRAGEISGHSVLEKCRLLGETI